MIQDNTARIVELEHEDGVLEQALKYTIENQEEADAADVFLKKVITGRRKAVEELETDKQAKYAVYKAAQDLFKTEDAKWELAEKHVRDEIDCWLKEAETRRARESERLGQQVQDLRLEEAAQLEAAGDIEGANRLLAEIVDGPAPQICMPKAKIAGISKGGRWRAEITSWDEFLEGIMAGETPKEAISPDMPFLNKLATRYKETKTYRGMKFVKDTSIAVR